MTLRINQYKNCIAAALRATPPTWAIALAINRKSLRAGLYFEENKLSCVVINASDHTVIHNYVCLLKDDQESTIQQALFNAYPAGAYKIQTIYGLAPQYIMSKRLMIDQSLTDHEICAYLNMHCKEYFGYDANKLYHDYQIIMKMPQQKIIQVIATQQQLLDRDKKIIAASPFRLIAVDIIAYALQRFIDRKLKNSVKSKAIIYCNKFILLVCVLIEERLYFRKMRRTCFNKQMANEPFAPWFTSNLLKLLELYKNKPSNPTINHIYLFSNFIDNINNKLELIASKSLQAKCTHVNRAVADSSKILDNTFIISYGLAVWGARNEN